MNFAKIAFRLAIATVVTIVVSSACGSASEIDSRDASAPLSCVTGLEEIVTLLRSGLPTYDYEPAPDLKRLVERSDAVVTGSIDSLGRFVGAPNLENGTDNSWTVVSTGTGQVLHSFPEAESNISTFSISSFWPSGAGDDPIEGSIAVDGVSFVAFLDRFEAAPGGYAVEVQGLVVACTASDDTPLAIIEPLPADARGLPLDDLVVQVGKVSAAASSRLRSGLDGPVMRHPQRALSDEGASAEIVGVLELEGDCLYLRPQGGGERFPLVWPADTRWDEALQRVTTPGGDQLGVTDEASGGGGYHSVADIERIAGPEAAALAAACVDNEFGEVAVVNNFDSAIGRISRGLALQESFRTIANRIGRASRRDRRPNRAVRGKLHFPPVWHDWASAPSVVERPPSFDESLAEPGTLTGSFRRAPCVPGIHQLGGSTDDPGQNRR